MKNLLVISAILFSTQVFSQVQKISFGLMVPVIATAPLPFTEKPFGVTYDLTPSVNLITTKTHHHLAYGTQSNSIQAINGYFLKNNWDVYNFFSKNLNDSGMYLGFGIEKAIVVNENLLFFPFVEVGTNFKGKKLFSFGVVIHPSLTIWKR